MEYIELKMEMKKIEEVKKWNVFNCNLIKKSNNEGADKKRNREHKIRNNKHFIIHDKIMIRIKINEVSLQLTTKE